jgi:hypothetical protein
MVNRGKFDKKIFMGLIILFIIFFQSCEIITTVEPLGYEPMQLNKDFWNGEWVYSDKSEKKKLIIEVIDSGKGIIKVEAIEKDDNKEIDKNILKFRVLMRKGNKNNYINILFKDIEDKEKKSISKMENTYFWCVIKEKENKIYIFYPKNDKFKELIETHKINGSIDKDLIIDESSDNITTIIENRKFESLFNTKEVIVLIKESLTIKR